jgi:DNA-binding response OmpR family regulator
MNSILVVEDDKSLRNFLAELLTENDFIVQTTANGISALEMLEKSKPDLVILDLGLPKMNGESVCVEIKKKYPELKVIILTGKNSNEDIIHGLNLGADDYVTKPFEADILIARVNARLRHNGDNKNVLHIANLVLDKNTHEVKRGERLIELTPKEFVLLEYLMLNQGRVLTRDMILNRIWVNAYDVESRVVDIYIGFLRKKIDAGEKKKLIKSVRGFGYMVKES